MKRRAVTFEKRWCIYVARIAQTISLDDLGLEIEAIKAGDDHLMEFAQQRLRRESGRTCAEDEQRRWIYDCAVIGDTIASVMDIDRWTREPFARSAMLQQLSDYLGVHYFGREARRMPRLRFARMDGAGLYLPRTRRIQINCQMLAHDDPWEAAATVMHERAHDWQTQIMRGHTPSGHILSEKILRWRATIKEPYTKQEIERDAYRSEVLVMLRWALRLDEAPGFSEFGLDTRQLMYGLFDSLTSRRSCFDRFLDLVRLASPHAALAALCHRTIV